MLQKNKLPPEAFGTEKNQNELSKAVYPEIGKIEETETELPAFFDLRAANTDKNHQPRIITDHETLEAFVTTTIKQRRNVELYELLTIDNEHIRWVHRPIPDDVYSSPFKDIAKSLADIMFRDDRCVGIRIEVDKGVYVGLFDGDTDDIEYTGQIRIRYRPIGQHKAVAPNKY